MQQDMFWLVASVSMVVMAVSVAVIAWALVRLAAEAGRTADETDGLLQVLREELPPTLAAVERAAASIDQLAGEGAGALATFDTLATEAESTMVAVRELSGSVNDIVRGPADTVTGVKRSARMVGGGIASGADRLRRVITGEHDEE